MSSEIVETVGYFPPEPVVRQGQYADTTLESLANYLSGPTSRCVEQEAIDPVPPVLKQDIAD